LLFATVRCLLSVVCCLSSVVRCLSVHPSRSPPPASILQPMHLSKLQLTNFRNYPAQTLDLAPGPVLLLGPNAQGKTNILEAIFLLATGRSERSTTDADLIAWSAVESDDPQPIARIVAEASRTSGEVTVELSVVGREGAHGIVASKRFRLNGVPKRAADVFGAVTAVLFTTDD